MKGKHVWLLLILPALLAVTVLSAQFTPAAAGGDRFPDIISLPDGFNPEGVVTGRGAMLYAGSLADGAIYKADLRTGAGEILVPGLAGSLTVGLSFDQRTNYIYAAGGPAGTGAVYDAGTGATVATFSLTSMPSFVNDVVVMRDAAYFTDSARPVLYRLPLGPGGKPLPGTTATEIALGGDFQFEPGQFNANGIDATPDGRYLIVVNSFFGELYRVDPATGVATLVDLGGASVASGDGILLDGKTLYVVRNFLNQIAVVQLDPSLTSGAVVGTITDPVFDIPTTVAEFGSSLYAVNAKFGQGATSFEVVRVDK